MGKVKSLKKSLAAYMAVFALAAVLMSFATYEICDFFESGIENAYPFDGERYYLTNENGERLGEGAVIGRGREPVSERDENTLRLLKILQIVSTPFYSAFAVYAAAVTFYKNKLKNPIKALSDAAEKFAENDLDFSIEYDGADEMGLLCAAFEKTRKSLEETLKKAWRRAEEQRCLAAAFAHDIRTPLTVIKGYGETLAKSDDEKTRRAAEAMGRGILKIERYGEKMAGLSRIEDIEPEFERVFPEAFFLRLSESAEALCEGKRFLKTFEGEKEAVIDGEIVSEVVGNLITNGARYAKSEVRMAARFDRGGLYVTVSDDGEGFDAEGLRRAGEAYYTSGAKDGFHMGLGLYISKILCEKHGGYLKIENDGGARVTAFFKNGPLC